ncbi:2Fe-2S iron-sulfur cluster-binding protein [Duganella aceris]|uniref:2Fe-2S iron-sulfur cluster binding domain-containing protein n=1 Tax=Duganella aceris TaxID=2703883 RepID=A0ABX0FJE1_9BURK|nr:2Fe-2S iron-sulfur cluster-binding protein [Duganella aceris]NGZ84673.1 2Fe-2S iron-sulfur cluster binding domain-containing protein [Duganella aceris]
MGRAYSDITFTPAVRDVQRRMGSRAQYEFLDDFEQRQDSLGRKEIRFVEQRDHFFQATVNETGWPYVQHRGGPAGFLKVIDPKTLGFADFHGNVQYLSVGNLKKDDRISLILVDQAEQVRLKIIGRARTVEAADDPALIERLRMPGYRARIERAFIITVEGYDWNCPQHITPRFTEQEVGILSAPLHAQIKRLKEQVSQLTQLQAQLQAAPPTRLGDGPLALVIAGVRQLTPRVRAYELRSADGSPLPPVSAGAHLDVPMLLAEGGSTTRCYSISSNPALPNSYEIAVLREEHGTGGSEAVHADFRLGLELNCSMPGNDFALADDGSPALLIAGGIGITPIKAMAHQLLAQGRDFELHYAARSRGQAPFADQLIADFGQRVVMHIVDDGGRMDIGEIVAGMDATTVLYTCGPLRMIDAVRDAAANAGIATDRVRFERFASDAARPDDQPVFVTLSRSGKVIEVPADTSILDAVQAAGVAAPASCRIGNCGTCAVDVLAGTPDHRDEALSEEERAQGRMCICVSRAKGPALTLDL